jgi:uncharacterized protein YdeI (YjbR/CyaY-like superfamily)
MKPAKPIYFSSPAEWRAWLEKHHASSQEVLVGYYKRDTGLPSMTWSESVDEALCVGWIDGIRRSVDEKRYCIRFTPRKPGSTWSRTNLEKVKALVAASRMKPAGMQAFEKRSSAKSAIYSYEQNNAQLAEIHLKLLRANPKAWAYFQTLPAGYLKQVSWWVTNARRVETQQKRLELLIKACEDGIRLNSWKRKE